jgi:hypothetical protein
MAPFCILIRHVYIWLEMMGYLVDHPSVQDFVKKCLHVQDSDINTVLATIPAAWEAVLAASVPS